jgi:class 3 adenylate cyclase
VGDTPEVRYARGGEAAIAYSVTGDGPLDVVYVPGYVSHVEYLWEGERSARFLRRLASFSRLVLIDRRAIGLSDRLSPHGQPPLETQVDDLVQVLDEVGLEHAALLGAHDGACSCALFAATFPHRISACVLYGALACGKRQPGYPWQWSDEVWDPYLEALRKGWGTQAYADEILRWMAPSVADDEATRTWWARLMRLAGSPGTAGAMARLYRDTDIRGILGSIQAPTLVAHRTDDQVEQLAGARYLAEQIPGAKFVELPGTDYPPWGDDAEALLGEIEEFLTGARRGPESDRVLATVLFTDIVDSTKKAAQLGDAAWMEVLAVHDERAGAAIERLRGRRVKTTGDGLLATFDGPARAVRCAQSIRESVRPLGLEIRAGCHTGEIELAGNDVRGLAVHIGARVSALAGPGEVLVSSTVKDLTVGSGLTFQDIGERDLKGVPGPWHVYRVAS